MRDYTKEINGILDSLYDMADNILKVRDGETEMPGKIKLHIGGLYKTKNGKTAFISGNTHLRGATYYIGIYENHCDIVLWRPDGVAIGAELDKNSDLDIAEEINYEND